ncbi:SDR family NAD(P)-dependent oxidoreductase [Mumia sp. zg.B17]|nr:SDR family NAD(P)-dependent oxidoreductase [Mumia sp. zg.B17]
MPRDVLITGGSGGIGQELARRCVEIGDRVVVTGRDEGRLVASVERSGARPVVCDPTRPEEVEALVRQVGGSVDVLVNMSGGNADFDRQGVDHPRLDDVADTWRTNLDTNLLSTVLVTTAALGDMRPGGAVVNVGSIGAEYASTSYGVAKAAVQAWTAGLSREVARGASRSTPCPRATSRTRATSKAGSRRSAARRSSRPRTTSVRGCPPTSRRPCSSSPRPALATSRARRSTSTGVHSPPVDVERQSLSPWGRGASTGRARRRPGSPCGSGRSTA